MKVANAAFLLSLVLVGCAPIPTTSDATGFRDRREPATGIEHSVHVSLGVPTDGDNSDDLLMDHALYVTSYNPQLNVPNWASWQLDESYVGDQDRTDDFRADHGLPESAYRVTPKDYLHSGFDMGHLCPAKDRSRSREDTSLTFLMTNMHPQRKELNRVRWKNLEDYSRRLVLESDKELYIVAGGLFDAEPETIGHDVAIPRAAYKIVVVLERGQGVEAVTRDTDVIAVIMPNEETVKERPWSSYLVSVDEIEQQSGYDFLNRVPAAVQRVLEAKKATVSTPK